MEWACTNCGRTYDDPPDDVCLVCASGTIVPDDDAELQPRDAFLDRLRRVVVDPESIETDLTGTSGAVSLAFRLVAVLSVLILVAVGVAVLL